MPRYFTKIGPFICPSERRRFFLLPFGRIWDRVKEGCFHAQSGSYSMNFLSYVFEYVLSRFYSKIRCRLPPNSFSEYLYALLAQHFFSYVLLNLRIVPSYQILTHEVDNTIPLVINMRI